MNVVEVPLAEARGTFLLGEILMKKPHSIEICIENSACNMSCKYCAFKNNLHKHTNKLPEFNTQILNEKLKDISEDYNGEILIWGGEPLVNFEYLKKLIIYLRDKFKSTKLFFVTNGLLLNTNVAKFLIDYSVSISISHDGSGQHLRGIDPFKNTEFVESVKLLIDKQLLGSFQLLLTNEAANFKDQIKYWDNISKLLGIKVPIHLMIPKVYSKEERAFLPRVSDLHDWITLVVSQLFNSENNSLSIKLISTNNYIYRVANCYLNNAEQPYACVPEEQHVFGITGNDYFCSEIADKVWSGLVTRSEKDFKWDIDRCKTCSIYKYCDRFCLTMSPEEKEFNCDFRYELAKYIINLLEKYKQICNEPMTLLYTEDQYQIINEEMI